jgi:hypothetical protein
MPNDLNNLEVGWSDTSTPDDYEWSAFDGRRLPELSWRFGLYRRWEPHFVQAYYKKGVFTIFHPGFSLEE